MDYSRWPEIQQQQQQQQRTNPLHGNPSLGQLYNAPPQSYTPYAYYPSNPNPNPADPLAHPITSEAHPHFDLAGPDTSLRPPGVDPYAPNPYAPHAGYERLSTEAVAPYVQQQQPMQPEGAAYFHDPNAQQQNWGTNELIQPFVATNPLGYAAAVVPSNGMEQMVGVDPNPMVWNNQRVHPFARGIPMKRSLKKTKVVQSAWCELCKVDCNSQEILNTHKVGKKHMKNLKKLEESKNIVATASIATREPEYPATVTEFPSGESAKGKKMSMKQTSASKPGEDLETKKQKLMESGVAVDSLRVCTVCNVVCNSDTVFNLHLSGQKHAAKLASAPDGMRPMVGPNPNPNPVTFNDQGSIPFVNGAGKKKKKNQTNKIKVVQLAWCDLCKIECSSHDILNKHELGRRHKKNLEKLNESKNVAAPAAAAAVKPYSLAGTNEIPQVEKAKTSGGKKRKKVASTIKPGEDWETKKRKLLECGTAVDSLKVCEICNVVCNSEMVYRFHLAGQKHATLVKKNTAASKRSAVGLQAVTAATATSDVGPQAVPATTSPAIGPQPVITATATSAANSQPVTAS